MNIAHLSDIHYCPKHLKWVDRAMTAAVDGAIAKQCDVMVISGDSFDRAMSLHEPAVSAYYSQVIRAANHMPVAVLAGTLIHDPVGCLNVLKHVPTKYGILVIDKPGAWTLFNKVWVPVKDKVVEQDQLLLCGLPSLNKAETDNPKEHVIRVMAGFAPLAAQARAAGVHSILTAHGEVLGSVTESNHAMISPDHEFTEEILFSSGCDAIMLGHIHKRQEFYSEAGQVAAYAGSLARLVFGDHEDKGWLNWLFQDKRLYIEQILSPTRNLVEIEFDGAPDMDELAALAETVLEDDSVRVLWTIDQEFVGIDDKKAILALFSHVETVKLDRSILPIQSVRAAEMLEAQTLEAKVKVWLESTGDIESFDATAHRLAKLQTADVTSILEELK